MTKTRFNDVIVGDDILENPAPLGKVGAILLATDLTLEGELRQMLPHGVGVYTNRVMNHNPLTMENLRAMGGDLRRAAAGIVPGAVMDVVVYGCTSGAAAIGYDEVRRLVQSAHPQARVITPLTAAVDACRAIGVRRLSILTPYIAEINRALAAHFADAGFAPVNVAGMGMASDVDVAGVRADVLLRAARGYVDESADALFVSCTALRTAQVVGPMEDALGIPVLSSNQTLAWAVLRAIGCDAVVEGFGGLLQRRWG